MDISDIEDKIIYLYSQGTSTRDIERTMQEMYGIEVDATRVSKITDKLLPLIRGLVVNASRLLLAHAA